MKDFLNKFGSVVLIAALTVVATVLFVACSTVQYSASPAMRGAGAPMTAYQESLAPATADADGFFVQPDQDGDPLHPHHNREAYDPIVDNPFLAAMENPLSTFSIDVDTASYANVRRFLQQGQMLPPPGAVRIEELINYFRYHQLAGPAPTDASPFAVATEVATCPWQPDHRLVRIAIKARELDLSQRQPANLVFLIDVSGSMQSADKLDLLKRSLTLLTEQLDRNDRVAIVVYAGASGLVLDSTANKRAIQSALDRLEAGGSTNGAAGIELAYATAQRHFIQGGVNRVILCTDGDFNVGVTDRSQLNRLIEQKETTGVYLTILGFGQGNLQDATMEDLSNRGGGNYAYIDSFREAEKVLSEQLAGTLVTVAKDVKIQVEFNPLAVQAYRLIGYENRLLAKEDFNDDSKDAGDIGAGHSVTALYQVVPTSAPSQHGSDQLRMQQLQQQIAQVDGLLREGNLTADARRSLQRQLTEDRAMLAALQQTAPVQTPRVDGLKYQQAPVVAANADPGELLTLKLRYKHPTADKSQGTSQRMSMPVANRAVAFEHASNDTQLAATVAAFGMLLRESPYRGSASWPMVQRLADRAADSRHLHHVADASRDAEDRREFRSLVETAADLVARHARR